MTVEENRGSSGSEFDEFPKGMRVLAVDDDPTCLKLLDGLLRKCQYHVTPTSQARMALSMLRENRNRFDLIISDVHMPDMDGFKLLELVGLEMDLPVIMLSANSDPKLVMKGITHGACDYLIKPVRIEELKNIWQHVIRKKKVEPKSHNKTNSTDRDQHGSENGQGPALSGNADQNGKVNRKRKEEEDDGEENENGDDDPSTQKKPRVVWSIELHRKFVAAVNQLGLEKAVPKRILDLMNVEGLTRENVASHLQKYRLYLKRISSAASQQANMVAALGGKDASYLRMGSLDGLGDFRTLAGSGRLSNNGLSSYSSSGMLGRLNSSSNVSLRSLNQPSHAQNLSNSMNTLGKFQPIVLPSNQTSNLFQGIPSSLELDHFQQTSKSAAHIVDFNLLDDHGLSFTASSTVGGSSNLLPTGSTNPLMLQGNGPHLQNGAGFINQSSSSINMGSLNSESFNIGVNGSSNILEDGRSHDSWQNNAFQLSKFPTNTSALSEPFSNAQMYNNSSPNVHIQNSPLHFPSNSAVSAAIEDSNQRFRQVKQDYSQNSNNAFSTLNSLAHANGGLAQFSLSLDQNNGGYNRKMDVSFVGRSNGGASTPMNMKFSSNEGGYISEQTKSQGGLSPNNYDSLDDLMNAVMKREQDGTMLMEGEFGFDAYSFGSCI